MMTEVMPGSPQLMVAGDVINMLTLSQLGPYEALELEADGGIITCIRVADILADAEVSGEIQSVFFSAIDGIMAEIPYEQIDSCYLTLTAENGWECVAPGYPPQSNIKHMDKLVVNAAKPAEEGRCVRINRGSENIATLTYGKLFTESAIERVITEGQPIKDSYNVTALTRRSLIPISTYTGQTQDEMQGEIQDETQGETQGDTQGNALAYLGNGSQVQISLEGYLEWRGNTVDYIASDGKSRKKDITGIWIEAPEPSVTDIASIIQNELKRHRVLVIELDGVGMGAFSTAIQNKPHLFPYLNGANEASRTNGAKIETARTVMPSVSSVALASILTGLEPAQNGITKEKVRELGEDVQDIFAMAADNGKTSAMVEGNTKLISTSIDQLLNPDINNDGSTDDEVFTCAKDTLSKGNDLTYVHFHGYDDAAHTFGPSSDEAFDKLFELSQYVQELSNGFSGRVIICSDHGMHQTTTQEDKLGEHGTFLPLDMMVPIIIFEV